MWYQFCVAWLLMEIEWTIDFTTTTWKKWITIGLYLSSLTTPCCLSRMERLVGQYLDTLLPAVQLFDKTFKFLLYNYLFHYQVNYGVALSIVIANLPVRRGARYCFIPCLLGFFSFPRMTDLAWSYWEKETVLPNFIKNCQNCFKAQNF